MKLHRLLFLGTIVVSLSAFSTGMSYAAEDELLPEKENAKSRPAYVEGEVLIKYRDGSLNIASSGTRKALRMYLGRKGLEEKASIERLNTLLVSGKGKRSTEQMVQELKGDPSVEYVQPNFYYYASSLPNDPQFSSQWGLHNTGQWVNGVKGTVDADIDFPEARDLYAQNTATSTVTVAVIDSGVDRTHEDLAGRVLQGYDFIDLDNDPSDLNGHGTHVAGIIAAATNNGKGVAGVGQKVNILPVRAFDANGRSTTYSVVNGIDYARDAGAKIVNMSFGSYYYDQFDYDAIVRGRNAGVLYVVAAGNEGNNNDGAMHSYPASYDLDNIISVAASTQNDNLASWSNYGQTTVDVTAPGVNIMSAYPKFVEIWAENFEGASLPTFNNTQFTQSSWGDSWNTKDYDGNVVAKSDLYSYPYRSDGFDTIESDQLDVRGYGSLLLEHSYFVDTEPAYLDFCFYDYLAVYTGEWDSIATYCGDVGYGSDRFDVTDYMSSRFSLKYIWNTDSSFSNYYGAFIDDIRLLTLSNGGGYQLLDGTSMAAPVVTGLAALIKSYQPSMTGAQIKERILTSVDAKPSLQGKVLTGGRINAYNALSDFAAPSGSVKINSDDVVTNKKIVTLNLNATDEGNHAIFVQALKYGKSPTIDENWSDWQPLTKKLYWAHSRTTSGTVEASVRFKDAFGNVSAVASDTIEYDTKKMDVNSTIQYEGVKRKNIRYTNNSTVHFTFATKQGSLKPKTMRFSNDCIHWTAWQSYGAEGKIVLTNKKVGGSKANGKRTLCTQLRDKYSRIKTSHWGIYYDTTGPAGTVRSSSYVTNNPKVTLKLAVSDEGVGTKWVAFNTGDGNWSDWKVLKKSMQWDISDETYGGSSNLGYKNITYAFADKLGNVSSVGRTSVYFTTGQVLGVEDINIPESTVRGSVTYMTGSAVFHADVKLLSKKGNVVKSTKTNKEGKYTFRDVPAEQSYRVRVTHPQMVREFSDLVTTYPEQTERVDFDMVGKVDVRRLKFDARGDDAGNLNGEFVILKNNSETKVKLTGWRLLDKQRNRFLFPAFTLQAGREVTIYTGEGTNTATELYWGRKRPVWNNDQDTVLLKDASGDLVAKYRYSE